MASLFGIFSKLKRTIQSSLLWKIGFAITLFSLAINSVHIFSVNGTLGNIFKDYFAVQLNYKVETLKAISEKDISRLSHYIAAYPIVYPNIKTTIIEDNEKLSYLRNLMNATRGLHQFDGYVLADRDGVPRRTNFSNYTEEQMNEVAKLFKYVRDNDYKPYDGYFNLLNEGLCAITVHAFKDANGDYGAYALVCQSRMENEKYVSSHGEIAQCEINIVRDGVYRASTINDSINTPIGKELNSTWVNDTVLVAGHNAYLTEKFAGNTFYSTYFPIKTYNGSTIGIYNAAIDVSVSNLMSQRMILVMIMIALGFGSLCLVVIIIYFKRRLTTPIKALEESATLIAEGDLTSEVYVSHTQDEVNRLGNSMKRMQQHLANIIGALVRAAEKLQSASNVLREASHNLSDGANKQAASLEEVSSSLEEMTSNIHQNTDNSIHTEALMNEADTAVASIAHQATNSMNDTRQIAVSIKDINELVKQTNILSLNASVEAARAGAYGRGFAVVAKEVGRLAERTQETAHEVSDTATKSIAGSEEINKLLDAIAPQLHEVAMLIKEITTSSQEQGVGADQISIAINDLNKETQNTAARADEIATNAHDLYTIANKMKGLVDRFKVN
ncbi:MAG: HAMP domain-containing protein [Bacteroidales bacterium]|jgi:methyl-accepting chemotaxis protein|nr:HAMP domain-containing protein [Bacteroidales bacterium]